MLYNKIIILGDYNVSVPSIRDRYMAIRFNVSYVLFFNISATDLRAATPFRSACNTTFIHLSPAGVILGGLLSKLWLQKCSGRMNETSDQNFQFCLPRTPTGF